MWVRRRVWERRGGGGEIKVDPCGRSEGREVEVSIQPYEHDEGLAVQCSLLATSQ